MVLFLQLRRIRCLPRGFVFAENHLNLVHRFESQFSCFPALQRSPGQVGEPLHASFAKWGNSRADAGVLWGLKGG